jgi:hypothetical protein
VVIVDDVFLDFLQKKGNDVSLLFRELVQILNEFVANQHQEEQIVGVKRVFVVPVMFADVLLYDKSAQVLGVHKQNRDIII